MVASDDSAIPGKHSKETGDAGQVEYAPLILTRRTIGVEPEYLFCCKRKLKQTLAIGTEAHRLLMLRSKPCDAFCCLSFC